ncbi:MAG: hypothetical protein ACJ8R9_33430 [Steroidobacteraceae bacterium]
MSSEQQASWRRHIAFDPMNAHSQGDDPTLMYVMQFNADEREWWERSLSEVGGGGPGVIETDTGMCGLSDMVASASPLTSAADQEIARGIAMPLVKAQRIDTFTELINPVLAQQGR